MQDQIELLSKQTGISTEAIQVIAHALVHGNGKLAQFNHPELGGSGQWMSGMIMIGDMFNQPLKAKVSLICEHLAEFYGSDDFGLGSHMPLNKYWWKVDFGNPTSTGGQNAMRYAYFQPRNRLIILQGTQQTVYDTKTHIITGVSQQQSQSISHLVFVTRDGRYVTVEDFEKVMI